MCASIVRMLKLAHTLGRDHARNAGRLATGKVIVTPKGLGHRNAETDETLGVS